MNDHGKSKRERRHFTGQQKVAIVKAHKSPLDRWCVDL